MSTFNKMQLLKRRFFAMRNGAVADSLRRQGAPYRIIFGLNLPQLAEIARDFAPDIELSVALRDNVATRESLLIAPMLYPADAMTVDEAVKWLENAMTTEVVDVACLKLFKRMPAGVECVIARLANSDISIHRYAALRLGANILPAQMDEVEQLARLEVTRDDAMTRGVARMILDDIEWRRECEQAPL